MTRIFLLATIVLFVLATPALAAPHGVWPQGAATTYVSPNGCYDCYPGAFYGGFYGVYGEFYGFEQGHRWSAWNRVRLKYHYPYTSGITQPNSPWHQHPGPFAHSYRGVV